MFIKILIMTIILGVELMSQNLENELKIFTAQKYRVDYISQTEQVKETIKKEYLDTKKLSSKIYNDVKNDISYKIALDNINITFWSQKFMTSLEVNEDELKKLYEKENPKTVDRFNLRNILVKDEKVANTLLSKLKKTDEDDLIVNFTKLVKENSEDITTRSKEGKIGWIEINKLEKPLQEALKNKKKNELIKIKLNDFGWQIVLIEDYQAQRKATFEESKQYLENIIRQQKLNEEIQKLLK